ncbi:MAG: glycosyltransferase family 4 protein [bacterium]|nr:glycosyltransferase family 4 protein [bacterium]
MKICYLASADSIHTIKWAKYFYDRKHRISMISLHPFSYPGMDDVESYVFKPFPYQLRPLTTPFNQLYNLARIRSLIGRIRPDIIHVQSFTHYAWLGYLSGFHPLVITAWGSDILTRPRESRSYKAQVRLAIRKADLLTCDADHIIQPMVDLGARPEKIRIIFFGVDTRKFHPEAKDDRLAEELGFSGRPLIISLRGLSQIYDVESLVRAAPVVLKSCPSARFIIAGEGPLKTKLQELASSLGAAEAVRFIGNIPNDRLPRYLASSEIYVSTSLSDAGLSASTAEAMACARPVVITDFGDNRKWVEDGVSGCLVPLSDPGTLAARIIDLLGHPERRESFGKLARQVIMEKNDLYREMGKVETLYQQLIEKRG